MELKEYIIKHLKKLEEDYKIKIIFWSLRSSINMGIYRKNSDLDIYFVFESKKISIIHDLKSHTFDFWGASVETVKKSIEINQAEFDKKGINQYKPIYIDQAHKRAGCNYFYSLYFVLGNDVLSEYGKLYSVFENEINNFNKDIIIAQFGNTIKNDILNILENEVVPINTYLRTIWNCLFITHLKNDGVPGDYNLISLSNRYIQDDILKKEIKQKSKEYFCYAMNKNDLKEKNKIFDAYLISFLRRGSCEEN